MFGELPKLFDREFAVGFFLPSIAMVGAIWTVVSTFGIEADLPSLESWMKTILATAIVWLTAVALLALNYPILEVLEGYPKFYPFRGQRQKAWRRRFRMKIAPTLLLDQQISDARSTGMADPFVPTSFSEDMLIAADRYPDEEAWVLPSEIGNIFRALEVYSRVIYGMEAITIWPRLQAVLPDQFKKQLGEAWSVLNFFVNLMVGGAIVVVGYVALAVWTRSVPGFWIPITAIAVIIGSYRMSLGAILRYGAYVKSAFDLYRGELAKQLGLKLPLTALEEREMWQHVSKMMTFRGQRDADELAKFRTP